MLSEAEQKEHAKTVRARLWGNPVQVRQITNTEWKDQLIERQVAQVKLKDRYRQKPPDEHWRGIVKGLLIMHGVSLTRLRSREQDSHIAMVRAEIARALRNSKWSLPRIGELMDRDHTTIMSILEHRDEAGR